MDSLNWQPQAMQQTILSRQAYINQNIFAMPFRDFLCLIIRIGIFANSNCDPVLEFENKTGWYYINSDGEKVDYDVSGKEVNKNLFYQSLTIYCD